MTGPRGLIKPFVKCSSLAGYRWGVTGPGKLTKPPAAELLLRPANDSLRPISTIELALKVRPAAVLGGTTPVWSLEPQYDRWLVANFPDAQVWFCPLDLYDLMVRPADARFTLEGLDAHLREEAQRSGGYALSSLGGWRQRTAMFAVGSPRLKALVEFLFAWG